MNNTNKTIRRWVGRLLWLVASLMATQGVQAATPFEDNCGSCHAGGPNKPPYLLSQSATYGKIIPLVDDGRFAECLSTRECALRVMLRGPSSATMQTLADSLSNSDLDNIRLYLIRVRDAEVSTPTPSFTSTVIGSSTTATYSFAISNFRGTPINYGLSLNGSDKDDYTILSTTNSCGTSDVVPATTTSAASVCTISGTVRFQPRAVSAGTRTAQLHVDLSAENSGTDPAPLDKDIALSAQALTPTPGFTLTPSILSFSTRRGTATLPQLVATISNPSSATANLVLNSFIFSRPEYTIGSGSGINCTSGMSLDHGSSCSLWVIFNPTSAGSANGTLAISHNASGSPANVSLTGTGTESLVSATPTRLDTPDTFGTVQLHVPKALTLTVRNTGTEALNFLADPTASAARTGTAMGDFAVSSPDGVGCSTSRSVAKDGGSCTLVVTFTPNALGSRTATLTLTTDATNGSTPGVLQIPLGGTGAALPEPTVTLPSADFPDTVIGETAALTGTVTITNGRTRDITYVATAPTDFIVSAESCSTHVVPGGGGSCTLTLQFIPTASGGEGRRSATFNLTFGGTSGDATPVAVSGTVAGRALLQLQQTVTALTASAEVGTPSTVSTVLTNRGSTSLRLNALTFGDTYGSDFTLADTSVCKENLLLLGHQSCTLVIRFNPASADPPARHATLSIAHGAAGGPAIFNLTGTSTQALISASPISLNYDSVQLHVTKALTLTVSNSGFADLNFREDPTISGAGDFTVSSPRAVSCRAGSPVTHGSSCTLVVTFQPSAIAPRAATLTLNTNAANGVLEVDLRGTGVALPEPTVTLPSTDFPDTVIGETAAQTRTVTITNGRTRDITYVATAPTDFRISAESCSTRVVPGGGGSCTLTLQFVPTASGGEGRRSATFNLTFGGTLGDATPVAVSGPVAGRALLQLQQSAATLNAAAEVGTPSTVSAVLTNRGATALTLSTLTFGGSYASDYTLAPTNACTAGLSLPASGSCTLVVRFNPANAVPPERNATLSIVHAAAGSPQPIELHGTATPAPQGRIELSALSLSFPDTWISSSASLPVTVQNTGNLALTFSAFNLSGAARGEFERGGTCSTAAPLAIGAQCTVIITFRPTALNTRSAALTIDSDASNGSATISLTGFGLPTPAPIVTFSTATLDFGAQTVGGLYPARKITLTNTGNADLTIAALTVQGSTFANASTAPCPATLSAGASCDTLIAFSAPAASATSYTGTLTLTDNAAGSPHSVALTGSGTTTTVPVLVWSPDVSQVDFSATPVSAGSVSAARRVTLLNNGPGGVTLSVLNAVGADAAMFSVSAVNCAIGAPFYEGESCHFDVLFAPASAGAKHASIQIASTVNTFPPTVTLSGIGLGGPSPGMAFSPSVVAFDTTRVGAHSLPTEVRLSSNGSGVIRVTALQVSGPYVMQHKTCPALPFTLPAGSECSLTVSFVPQADGSAAGVLRVTTDASSAPQEIALSGQADPAPDVTTGGCSIGASTSPADPTLWALVLLAAAALLYRKRAQHVRRRVR